MKKIDFLFITFPFVLTAVLIVVGYNILIASTPEARISLDAPQNDIEILTNGTIEPVGPQVDLPTNLVGRIQPIPQNAAALTEIFKIGVEEQTNFIYLSLPVSMDGEYNFRLTGVENSSEENILRWAKTTISEAHKRNFHIVLAVTINAQTTISDSQAFTQKYNEFIKTWAQVANEYSISFFTPGITVGHPLYSQIPVADQSKILRETQRSIRKIYAGPLGLGLCCTDESEVDLSGYTYLTLIPTPEYGKETLTELSSVLNPEYEINRNFYYDRNGSRVETITVSGQ